VDALAEAVYDRATGGAGNRPLWAGHCPFFYCGHDGPTGAVGRLMARLGRWLWQVSRPSRRPKGIPLGPHTSISGSPIPSPCFRGVFPFPTIPAPAP
jgi:hypothetical protein